MMRFSSEYEAELETAIRLVRSCSSLARTIQAEMVTAALQKEDRSPVTVADLAVQALVGHRLKEAFPSVPLVAEESSAVFESDRGAEMTSVIARFLSDHEPRINAAEVPRWIDRGTADPGELYWVLDPIDGTKGFLRGDQYVVALALVEGGRVRLGVLGCPRLEMTPEGPDRGFKAGASEEGSLLIGVRGGGAWYSGLDREEFFPLEVSPCADAAESVLLRSVESGHTDVDRMRRLVELLGTSHSPVLLDSQAKYAVLAAGFADLLFRLPTPSQRDYREKIWDHAAGVVIVEEAGGRVSDIDGNPLDFRTGRKLLNNRGLLVSNGRLHERALEALARTESA